MARIAVILLVLVTGLPFSRAAGGNWKNRDVSCEGLLGPTIATKAQARRPLGIAKLSSDAIFSDLKTGKILERLSAPEQVARVYGTTLHNDFQLAIGFVDEKGKRHVAGTFRWFLHPLTRRNERKRDGDEFERNSKRQSAMQSRLRSALKAPGKAGIYLNDVFNFDWLAKIAERTPTVSILAGDEFGANLDGALKLAKVAIKNGFVVYFDGDAKSSEAIARVVGARGVAITVRRSETGAYLDGSQIITLTNPYLRMKAFSEAQIRMMTPDSVTGWGLLFARNIDEIVDSTGSRDTASSFSRWVQLIDGPSIGLKSLFEKDHYSVGVIKSDAEVRKRLERLFSSRRPEPAVRMNADSFISSLDSRAVEQMIEYKSSMVKNMAGLNKVNAYGAAVFGSSTLEPQYERIVYRTAREISRTGLPVVTGGANGFMRLANSAAVDAGGISIGIPLSGRQLRGEPTAASDVHTLTILTDNYNTRLPLLLHSNDLVVAMPGGIGTLKEVAVAFVNFAAQTNEQQHIVFVARNFYGPLVGELKESQLPQSVRDRIHLVDNEKDILPIIERLKTR